MAIKPVEQTSMTCFPPDASKHGFDFQRVPASDRVNRRNAALRTGLVLPVLHKECQGQGDAL